MSLHEVLWRNQGQTLTPELIVGILQGSAFQPDNSIPLEQFGSEEYKGFTFQAERFAEVVDELAPLHRAQWAEVDERLKVFEFKPNYAGYIAVDRKGQCLQFTIRKGGKLVGYCLVMLHISMHTQTLVASEDSLYMMPEHRGGFTMIRFIKYMAAKLFENGVKEIRVTSKVSNKAHVLMERAGFDRCAIQFVKMVGGEK